jgi:hypothetical protein
MFNNCFNVSGDSQCVMGLFLSCLDARSISPPFSLSFSLVRARIMYRHGIVTPHYSHSFKSESARPCACYSVIIRTATLVQGKLFYSSVLSSLIVPLLLSSFPSLSIVGSVFERVFCAIIFELYLCPKMTKYASGVFKLSGDIRDANASECLGLRGLRGGGGGLGGASGADGATFR